MNKLFFFCMDTKLNVSMKNTSISENDFNKGSISLFLKNNKGYLLGNVMTTLTVFTIILLSIFGLTGKLEKQIDNKQDISLAGASAITVASQYLSQTGSFDYMNETVDTPTISSVAGYDLTEGRSLGISLSKNIFGNSSTGAVELRFDTPSGESILGMDANGGKKDVATYSFDNGMIIDDTSLWSASERINYRSTQLDYIKNGEYGSGAEFVGYWVGKLNTAGSYMIFDLGKPVSLNSLTFGFTENAATASPKIIALTFDNGARYNFSIDTSKQLQNLSFMDVKTRYVKLDIVVTNDGEGSLANTVLGGVANIATSDVTVDLSNPDKIVVEYPAMINAEIKYYNIYFASGSTVPTAPALVVPQKSGIIQVNYMNTLNGDMIPNNVWIEPCVMDGICKEKVNKSF